MLRCEWVIPQLCRPSPIIDELASSPISSWTFGVEAIPAFTSSISQKLGALHVRGGATRRSRYQAKPSATTIRPCAKRGTHTAQSGSPNSCWLMTPSR
jgi:hypothetical protein